MSNDQIEQIVQKIEQTEDILARTRLQISEHFQDIHSKEEICRKTQNELTILCSARNDAGGDSGWEKINKAVDLRTELRLAEQELQALRNALFTWEKLECDLNIDIGRLQMQLDRLKNNVDNYATYGCRR